MGSKIIKRYLKLAVKKTFHFLDYPGRVGLEKVNFDNSRDYLFISRDLSAKRTLSKETISLIIFSTLLILGLLFFSKEVLSLPVLIAVSGLLATFYLVFMVFKLVAVSFSFSRQPIYFRRKEISSLEDKDLPVYTILIPLLRESEVMPQTIEALAAIDYPVDKLDIIITLEEDDIETINAFIKANPPKHFKALILPNVSPKTKPKALNVAFLQARGEFLVVYDAEIIPDPDQLKKAYLAFRRYPKIGCLQPRLDHYNSEQNILTRLFNAEFSFYYDLFLPGLQKLNFPIPLSGHSTHFRRSVLEKIGAWDPYNVTEDCDIGIRLHRFGYKVDVIDSVSKEEAASHFTAWIRQRSRWMKGFIQTSLVHLRYPLHLKKELGGWINFLAFCLTVPGTVLINVLNVFYWFLLIGWVTTQSNLIQDFFPGPILYLSVFTFVVGNFIFVYLNLIGVFKRGRFALVKYCLLSPFYWLLLAFATFRALFQVVFRPFQWEKTTHEGLVTTKESLIKLKEDYAVRPKKAVNQNF